MNAKTLLAAPLAATAAFGLTGCTSVTTTCTVRHRYAIVIFQNGFGNGNTTYVTGFRLNVEYGPAIEHWPMQTRIVLNVASDRNPELIVKTYRVGEATGCRVDEIAAHQ